MNEAARGTRIFKVPEHGDTNGVWLATVEAHLVVGPYPDRASLTEALTQLTGASLLQLAIIEDGQQEPLSFERVKNVPSVGGREIGRLLPGTGHPSFFALLVAGPLPLLFASATEVDEALVELKRRARILNG